MGHRALVAYERPDGSVDLHYSHWGAADFQLASELSEDSPLGGPDASADWASAVRRRLDVELDPEAATDERSDGTVVDPTPIASGRCVFTLLAAHLDFVLHEACYVVSPSYEVRTYLPVRFDGLQASETGDGKTQKRGGENGALLEVRPGTDDAAGGYVRGWFDAVRSVLDSLVEAGVLTEHAARSHLRAEVRRWHEDGRDAICFEGEA